MILQSGHLECMVVREGGGRHSSYLSPTPLTAWVKRNWSGGIFLTPSISVCYDRNTVCVGWVVVIFWNSWSTTAKWTWVEKQSSNAFQGPQSYVATSATAETHAHICECVWNSSMYIRCLKYCYLYFEEGKIPSMPSSEAIFWICTNFILLEDEKMFTLASKMIVP